MEKSRTRILAVGVGTLAVLIAGAWLVSRPPAAETCFDRLGGPGPNSNTSRLDTTLDIPREQWSAVAPIFRDFAAARGWMLQEGQGDRDAAYRWMDLCDQAVTIVRASNSQGEGGRIGFEIIHMTYQGPGDLGWQEPYRDLHRRLEARWPGRMRYVGGEFRTPIERPSWLDAPPEASVGERPALP